MIMNHCCMVFCLLCCMAHGQQISKDHLKKDIDFLASDALKGRGTSSAEEKKAAAYIAEVFKENKLLPKGDLLPAEGENGKGSQSYFYEFTFKKNSNPHDTSTVHVAARHGINVVGFLDNGAANTIVIGAHYDHLGLGHDHNSLDANPEGKVHNGVDDNASGTAGVLELARYFCHNNKKERYNFLFMCFSAEELGLLGSKKWCDKPTIPLGSINYMINLDMIGRLNDTTKKLMVYGVGTSPVWVPLLDVVQHPFSLKKDSSGIGPSDQTSFYLKDIPVLHFFTGQHADYHKPGDDADRINLAGEQQVLAYIVALIEATDSLPKLAFTKTAAPATGNVSFKVTMGVMPDYAYEGKGLRIDGVTDGRPAAKAGVKAGGVVVQLGGDRINNIQDYMKALSAFKKGDTTTVRVLRNNKEMELHVTF